MVATWILGIDVDTNSEDATRGPAGVASRSKRIFMITAIAFLPAGSPLIYRFTHAPGFSVPITKTNLPASCLTSTEKP